MEFYSLLFIIFLAVVLILHYSVFKKYQWICLLVASLTFYIYSGSLVCLVFLLITAITVWYSCIILEQKTLESKEKSKSGNVTREDKKRFKAQLLKQKRIVLAIVLFINLGILCYFKYWNQALTMLRVGSDSKLFRASDLILPLGISFYTFQSIAYFMDVYNQKTRAEHNFFKYLLFISWFPQMIQGPINRFGKMSEQLYSNCKFDIERFERGLLLILFGAMKKYAIANLLTGAVSYIFDGSPYGKTTGVIVFTLLLYSIEQYADFSGGIDIVIGISKLFGVDMAINFRQPYFATSLADFWRRWHISLGAWMRDYVFYPFALLKSMQKLTKWTGKHVNKYVGRVISATIANILVFLLVGIWHGCQTHYIAWGLYNGVIIAFSEFAKPLFDEINRILHIPTKSKAWHLFRIIRTFIIVNIGWYFDRIEGISNIRAFIKSTLFHYEYSFVTIKTFWEELFVSQTILYPAVIILAIIIVMVNSVIKECGKDTYLIMKKWALPLRWGVYYVMIFLILISSMFVSTVAGFMYANF